jgi:hypothetical protein
LTPPSKLGAVVVIAVESDQGSFNACSGDASLLKLFRQVCPLGAVIRKSVCSGEIESKKRLEKCVLHHFSHALGVSGWYTDLLHQLVACCKQRGKKSTFHSSPIFRFNAECPIYTILTLELL